MIAHRTQPDHLLALIASLAIALIALLSPVSHTDSDAALTLLASQAMVDHHTLKMDAYVSDPKNAYDFDVDYRIRRRGGSYYYVTLGSPILSLPFVWAARRLGYDMLDPADDDAVQNAISALTCAVVFLLLYRLALFYAPPRESLLFALILMLGSALTSTLATALWNLNYAAVGMLLIVLEFARHDVTGRPLRWPYIVIVTGLSFLCRPTVAFLGFGIGVYIVWQGLAAWRRAGSKVSPRILWLGAAVTVLALVVARVLLEIEWLSNYYSPRRLWPPRTPLSLGVFGSLLSPSRGLLIFSPFLFAVLAGVALRWRQIRREPLFWLAFVWTVTHLIGVAIKGVWWGGFSYGPRMMAEAMIPAALVTLLVYKHRGVDAGAQRLMAAFCVLGILAVPIHAYQGLFNLETVRWNEVPNIDRHSEWVLSWRYPQFLASHEQIERRHVEIQRDGLRTYNLGQAILPRSDRAIFDGWWEAENRWRWSSRQDPALLFRLPSIDPATSYVLEWNGGALHAQDVTIQLNGEVLGHMPVAGFDSQTFRFLVPGGRLRSQRLNEVRFHVSKATPVDDGDRPLGLAMRSLVLHALELEQRLVTFRDDPYFLSGWSRAESGLRWSVGTTARLLYPLQTLGNEVEARLTARGLGEQRVELTIEGAAAGGLTLKGFEPDVYTFRVPPEAVTDRLLEIDLHLPDARRPEGETRPLAMAFIALEIKANAPSEIDGAKRPD